MQAGVNLFDPGSLSGAVRMIRDAENLIGDGHETYNAWKARINATIERGSRVLVGVFPDGANARAASRYGGNYVGDLNTPEPPSPGVYTAESVVHSAFGTKIKILFLPRGHNWRTGEPFSRRVAYYLRPEDANVLAYDQVDAETLRYFIDDRISRSQYRTMIPVLLDQLEELTKEREYERQFVNAMAIRVGDPTSIRETKAMIWDAIEWWKNKTICVRPIRQDDAKAWRMIERRVIRQRGKHPADAGDRELWKRYESTAKSNIHAG